MAFTANDYIVDAADLYGDTEYARVEVADWIRYLNAGVRATILVRPDANAVTESYQLSAGIKQSIPTAGLRMLDIVRNMGADGLTAGKIITPSDRKNINYSNLLWPAATGETAIDNFSYDREIPDIFYVSPPVHATTAVYVEIVTSQLPTAVTATGSAVGVSDLFFEPLVQYMMYKAFSADDEGVEFGKATQNLQNFFNLLQVEASASLVNGPETKE